MAISSRLQRSIYDKLEVLLGPEGAEAMVDALLQPNWREVATKDDLRAQSAELRGEMAELRGELRAEMQAGFASQTRWLVGANTGLAALAITVAKLLL